MNTSLMKSLRDFMSLEDQNYRKLCRKENQADIRLEEMKMHIYFQS